MIVTETITMDQFVSTVVVAFNTVPVTITDLQVATVTAATFQVRFLGIYEHVTLTVLITILHFST